jgi:hypothetical protein
MIMRAPAEAIAAALVAAMLGACSAPAPASMAVQDEAAAIDIAQRHQCLIPPIRDAKWHARLHSDGWYTWYGDDPPHPPALFVFISQQDGHAGQCYYVFDSDPDRVDAGSAPLGPDLPKSPR